MADDDAEQPRPSLEPPKLFRRRGKKPPPVVTDAPAEDEVDAPPSEDAAPAGTDVGPDPVEPQPVEPQPVEPEPEPVAAEPVEPEPVQPEPVPVAHEPAAEPVTASSTDPVEDEDTVQHADEPGFTDAATVPVHVGGEHDERAPDPRPDDVPDGSETGEAGEEREPRGPLLAGRNAALVTGLLVGVLLVLLSSGGSATCSAIRGTSACGAALGFPVIVVILALATVAGALLLRLLKLPAPGSTSFMAVALLGVVTGLFLGDSLDSWVVRVAYPFGSALAFLAAWWLTVSFDDPEVVRLARQEREQEVA